MARVWWDAMDWTSALQMQGAYLDTNNAANSYGVAGRFGGRAIQQESSTTNGVIKAVASQDRYSVGIAFKHNTLGARTMVMFGEMTTRTGYLAHVKLRISADGRLRVTNGSNTVLISSDLGTVFEDAWHYAVFGAIIHDSAGSVFLNLDGQHIGEVTGIDTRNAQTGVISTILIGGGQDTVYGILDDLYIDDTYDITLPERRVDTLYPDADGGTLNLTPSTGVNHYAVVDEATVSTADYLSGSTPGDIDLLDLTTLSYTPDAIDGVLARCVMAKTDAASREASIGIKSGATTDDGPAIPLTATPVHYHGDLHTVDPNTTAAWTKAAIDALQLQPKVVS